MTKSKLPWFGVLITVFVYCVGLNGPFLFDDWANLSEVRGWLNGQIDFLDAAWTESGRLGRPIPMLSFLLDAWISNLWPFQMKAVNLLLHLVIGLLLYRWLSLVLDLAGSGSRIDEWIVFSMVCLWWLHPLQVSTVLYVVQRMAQFSTLFMVLAMVVYIEARLAWKNRQINFARRGLLIWVPLSIFLGLMSKENAIVTPLLLLWIEWILFSRSTDNERKFVHIYFALTVGIPALVFSAMMWWSPEGLLGSFSSREFSLWERLLTQSRVLLDYLQQIFIPQVGRMGLYYDDYILSTDILSPASTFFASVSLIFIIAIAVLARSRLPLLSLGIGLFLIPQAVESTFFSLELYFEHRNYLSLIGAILCGYVAVGYISGWLLSELKFQKWVPVVFSLVVVSIAGMTFAKVWTWQDKAMIAEEGVMYHPQSLRANLDLANTYMATGAFYSAGDLMRNLQSSQRAINRFSGVLGAMTVDCIAKKEVDAVGLLRSLDEFEGVITLQHYQAANLFVLTYAAQSCVGVTNVQLGTFLDLLLERSQLQSIDSEPKRRVLQLSAKVWSGAGEYQIAAERYDRLVDGYSDFHVMILYTEFHIDHGSRIKAKEGFEILSRMIPEWLPRKRARLDLLKQRLQ